MAIRKVVIAQPRGYCAGVEMAVETVERALQRHGAPVYVFHEIVHNQHVVQDFSRRGVRFVQSIDEVPRGMIDFQRSRRSPVVAESQRENKWK